MVPFAGMGVVEMGGRVHGRGGGEWGCGLKFITVGYVISGRGV